MSETYAYGFGVMATGKDLYVVGTETALADEEVGHGIVFESAGGRWSGWSVDFTVAALAYAPEVGLFFLVGQNGQVEVTTSAKAWDETVDPSDDGPSSVRPINGACTTDRHVYVAGMRRQVYRRRLSERAWSRHDAGCLVDPSSSGIHGFNAIHGLREEELYAVGLRGEIWRCGNGQWQQLVSPTNVSLYVVRQLASGDVLIGGGLGTLLRGGAAGFLAIAHDLTEASITGIAELAGRVFVADEAGQLFELKGSMLEVVNDVPEDDDGGGQLDANGTAMVYVRGSSALLFDGKTWHDRTPPDNP